MPGHWVQYLHSVILFSFAQFHMSGPVRAQIKRVSENLEFLQSMTHVQEVQIHTGSDSKNCILRSVPKFLVYYIKKYIYGFRYAQTWYV